MNQIKHRYTVEVLYEYDDNLTFRQALEKATTEKANLQGADLQGADLYGANLYGAYLRRANLQRANLRGADLSGVNLQGADLGEHGKLIGERPLFQFGPIGSRADYVLSFITDKGIVIKTGCFTGTIDEFRAAVQEMHGDSDHAKEYDMAILMIKAHAAIWTPKEQAAIDAAMKGQG